jgi:predicted metalloprotease with PDZ domain
MRVRLFLVGLFFAVTFVGIACSAYVLLSWVPFIGAMEGMDHGFGVRQEVGRLVVGFVRPDGPAAALRTGDEIVSLRWRNIRHRYELMEEFQHLEPDRSYSLIVRRHGQLHDLTLRQESLPAQTK